MISANYFWLCILFLCLGTIAIRYSLIGISGRVEISPKVRELFSYIPAAILPAFVAPSAFLHVGHVEWLSGHERAVVLIAAGVLCYFTRSTLLTIVFGLAALYVLSLT